MQDKIQPWQLILRSMQNGLPVMLLYVLHSKGSSPGRQGFYMSVNANGEMSGSLGGGVMEHKFVELAKKKLKTDTATVLIKKQIHDERAIKERSGMICSGEQTIFLYRLQYSDIANVKSVINSFKRLRPGLLQLSPAGIGFQYCKGHDIVPAYFHFANARDFVYEEKIAVKDLLYIIGGGHCALALSNLMRMMDFHIHVYETRIGLNTFLHNTAAHEKTTLHSYSELKGYIPEGNNVYVVIMSYGYRTDTIALENLFGKKVRYIGVLGSKSKIAKMFSAFRQKGIPASILESVHAPIGIQIKSQAPVEIAVSIAAEIIQVRNWCK